MSTRWLLEAITDVLAVAGLVLPAGPRQPRLVRHGQLVHLQTPITAGDRRPSALSIAAGPPSHSRAVQGCHGGRRMAWLRAWRCSIGALRRTIGWIDNAGDAET